jgi:GalNAc5-diNAcBac-PP-undecaprenol beta-1,3-glucosyltransferase
VSSPVATVLVPTFDHGPLVRLALESVLAQTVSEIEVFLVGDGVPDLTREIAAELSERDARLRFFDNPKGPRHGEIHRHAALDEAQGLIVLYLADDDLWLPDHVETMRTALADADFATAASLAVLPGGEVQVKGNDFGRPSTRQAFLDGGAGISLSVLGHTLAAYRRLSEGWTTTPADFPTDRYFWERFVSDPDLRGAGTSRVTALGFASPARAQLAPAERLAEMTFWWDRVSDPEGRAEIHAAAFASTYGRAARLAAKLERAQRHRAKLEAKLEKALLPSRRRLVRRLRLRKR